jgi:hypothetical protein
MIIGKDMERKGSGLILVITRQLIGGTEENRVKPQPGYWVSHARFEPNTL